MLLFNFSIYFFFSLYILKNQKSDFDKNEKEHNLQPPFIDGMKDRFGDFYDKNCEHDPLPGPTKYDKQKYGLDQVAKVKSLVNGSAFMSESIRNPYGQYEKKLGPSFIIPQYKKQ